MLVEPTSLIYEIIRALELAVAEKLYIFLNDIFVIAVDSHTSAVCMDIGLSGQSGKLQHSMIKI